MLSPDLVADIGATAEVCGGSKWSTAAVRIACQHLQRFSEVEIRVALARCQQEVKGTLALADIVARMPDGRPAPDVAWSQVSGPETETFVTTDEVMSAWAAAQPLLAAGDAVAARMAFLAKYREITAHGRIAGRAPRITVSVGTDKARAETVLGDAVKRGLLPESDPHVRGVLAPRGMLQLGPGIDCDGVTHFVSVPPCEEWPKGALSRKPCTCRTTPALPPSGQDRRAEVAQLMSGIARSLKP